MDVDEDEIEGALALMDTMARGDLEGEEFQDTWTEALAQVIEAKRERHPLPEAPEEQEQPGKVLDLMSALPESVGVGACRVAEEFLDREGVGASSGFRPRSGRGASLVSMSLIRWPLR
ncbi:hypothetical protein [Streptomyces gilvus]|uniref:hypothetical protein n=1 Tax=Streptomyces gilvus TaxID=2920937 RepID=UPI001F0D0053|nr:hypothetical protein [Streptomyces sp. CME 23]MCH5676817.1 hypothetical protein [Streptomyces sp. CME 23]